MTLRSKYGWHVAGLWFPSVLVVLLAGVLVWWDYPDRVKSENDRVEAAVSEAWEDLLDDPSSADFVWERGKGVVKGDERYAAEFPATLQWKDWPNVGRGHRKELQGALERPEGRLVWVRDTLEGRNHNLIYGRQTDIKARFSIWYPHLFCAGVILVLLLATALCVKYFTSSVRTRDDFMAATAHDLTTPLVGLRFMIGRDDASARRLNERLMRIVDNVRDFMRLGGRRREPACGPFDLLKAYREAYALFEADYRALFKGEDVPLEVRPPLDPEAVPVLGDETLTVQILWNLLGNDLKYAAPYGRVKVVVEAEGDRVAVRFVDEGQGMTPRQMRKAFDRYYRAKTVLQSGKGGFGIGLCTAREFALAMGGNLTVKANTPRGCLFTLTIPRQLQK